MEFGRVNGEKNAIRFENPFTLKVGQVFTGFGIGCGVGIGVGRPLNLGAIPMLNQVMSATRGATDAFSGVSRHVNTSLRKLGAKNIEVGIGCGVGFGHGFGVGLAVKPGVLNQIQSCLVDVMTKMATKLGLSPSLALNQAAFPPSQNAVSTVNTNQSFAGSMMQLATKSTDQASQGLAGSLPVQIGSDFENTPLRSTAVDSAFGSRTEKVISNFLQNPLLKGEGEGLDEAIGRLQSERIILQMVLKHQKIIDELVEENERLRRILIEDLKVPSSKLEASSSGRNRNTVPCSECFECRRKQRKK
ncbi:uncharacterized protein LOC124844716 isoform X1 [Vigna umbellata]|uniref:uncharacterized protein LOC124844716 isoform X1 n=2 Tax=Vigna umbellata TaxID=87088 RepID=UPI001F5FB040|nr:uncharacterized protein LOC124844716 isoform X1 [Vigna umbellata]